MPVRTEALLGLEGMLASKSRRLSKYQEITSSRLKGIRLIFEYRLTL